jgi:hypothetical protein
MQPTSVPSVAPFASINAETPAAPAVVVVGLCSFPKLALITKVIALLSLPHLAGFCSLACLPECPGADLQIPHSTSLNSAMLDVDGIAIPLLQQRCGAPSSSSACRNGRVSLVQQRHDLFQLGESSRVVDLCSLDVSASCFTGSA